MPLDRNGIAKRAAQELRDGFYVNLGIGMPTLIPSYIPSDYDIMFHSENGVVGMGPPPLPGEEELDLISAGKGLVTLIPGGAYVNHIDSFAIARGGRLDCAVLGAFQVAANGDLCNWRLPQQKSGSVGGAMDIAAGAKRVYVMMTHTTREGDSKIISERTYPLTAGGVVSKVYTDMAIISVEANELILEAVAPGITPEDVQSATGAHLNIENSQEIKLNL